MWCDDHGRGYNRYVLFRRSFEMAAEPAAGTLHIFADTRYRLLVNGVVLGHGPARFFAASPEYDTYDVGPFLQPGANTIAVMVNGYGCLSFHSEAGSGGLIAWGQAADSDGVETDLATGRGWKAIECPAHQHENVQALLRPQPRRDLPRRPARPGLGTARLRRFRLAGRRPHRRPGALGRAASPLHPAAGRAAGPACRPHRHQRGALRGGRDVYSFIVVVPEGQFEHRNLQAVALTWLHSVVEQEVTLGAFWGRYWLNGQELKATRRDDMALRQDFRVTLHKGWNSFVVTERLYYGSWEFYLGLPRSAAIAVSAERQAHSPNIFLLAGPWPEEGSRRGEAPSLPFKSPEELPAELGPWRPWARERSANSAYAERAWKGFSPLQNVSAIPVRGAEYAAQVGDGTLALLYDFGTEVLGRPMLDFTAAEGTLVDLSYSEHLRDGLPADQRPHNARLAERCIAREGRQQWQTFHPRGMRYLEVLATGDLEAFELHGVELSRANYPVRNAGSFECSDPLLNRIWEVGRATQHACMEDAYLDCPRRERGLYSGDMLVQFYTNLAAFGDTALFRRCIELFFLSQDSALPPGSAVADGLLSPCPLGLPPGRHPDYSAIIVQALWHYYARSGDAEFLIEMKPRLARLMRGLASLKVEGSDLLDGSDLHPYIDRQRMDRGGVNCALNCFYQRAFADAARVMGVAGDSAAREDCQAGPTAWRRPSAASSGTRGARSSRIGARPTCRGPARPSPPMRCRCSMRSPPLTRRPARWTMSRTRCCTTSACRSPSRTTTWPSCPTSPSTRPARSSSTARRVRRSSSSAIAGA